MITLADLGSDINRVQQQIDQLTATMESTSSDVDEVLAAVQGHPEARTGGPASMPMFSTPLLTLFTNIGVDSSSTDVGSMDPASIMQTVGVRIRELNSGIRAFMSDISHQTNEAQRVRGQIETLQRAMADHPRKNRHGNVERDHPGIALNDELPDGRKVRDQLQAAGYDVPEGDFWPMDQANRTLEAMKSQLEQVNSGSEMNMIRLQNMISQRSQAFQMLSGFLQKMNRLNEQISGRIAG